MIYLIRFYLVIFQIVRNEPPTCWIIPRLERNLNSCTDHRKDCSLVLKHIKYQRTSMNKFFPQIYVGETLSHVYSSTFKLGKRDSLSQYTWCLINFSYCPAMSPCTKHMSNNSGYLVIFGSVVMKRVNLQTRDQLPIDSE